VDYEYKAVNLLKGEQSDPGGWVTAHYLHRATVSWTSCAGVQLWLDLLARTIATVVCLLRRGGHARCCSQTLDLDSNVYIWHELSVLLDSVDQIR
jgi:hypothetical protein